MQEIERKFLVTDDSYRTLAFDKSEILQGYICSGHGHTVRVRTRGDKGYLTIKGPSMDGISRFEWEKEIEAKEAMELLQLADGALIDKCRYLVEYEGHTFEVDEFLGDNLGLTIAEVELQSPDEEFMRPEWLGDEVTGIKRYYNSHLRTYPYSAWSNEER